MGLGYAYFDSGELLVYTAWLSGLDKVEIICDDCDKIEDEFCIAYGYLSQSDLEKELELHEKVRSFHKCELPSIDENILVIWGGSLYFQDYDRNFGFRTLSKLLEFSF